MVAPTPMHTLSNTQIETTRTEIINGKNRTIFEFFETPKMSTYLLAFIVSKYEGLTNSNNTFGVYARPEAKEQTALALSFGQEMLAKLGDYVGIDYYSVEKVKKMDMAVRRR
jgi:aminopeptidase N